MMDLVNIFSGKKYPGNIGVKICGITNPQDVTASLNAGVNALGFNFFPGSKRYIELEKERCWLETVPASILRVAVVVNPAFEEVLALAVESFIDVIQLHGEETPEFALQLSEASGKPVIKALRIRSAADLQLVKQFSKYPVLLDAFSSQAHGGTGETFDWRLLDSLPTRENILLSGGLNPENIVTALRLTKVRYVDVASGVEESPRKKCPRKMLRFIAEVRNIGL